MVYEGVIASYKEGTTQGGLEGEERNGIIKRDGNGNGNMGFWNESDRWEWEGEGKEWEQQRGNHYKWSTDDDGGHGCIACIARP